MISIQTEFHNFSLSLPIATYNALYALANKRHQPATQMALTAIEDWLKQQEAISLHNAIADYAVNCAGITDLDEDMETAGLEQLSSVL